MTALLDASLPAEDVAELSRLLAEMRTPDVDFADLRTRASGRDRFISLTVLVPGEWGVQRGHDLADVVARRIATALPNTGAQTHLEPHGFACFRRVVGTVSVGS